jgi:hypothetical protein
MEIFRRRLHRPSGSARGEARHEVDEGVEPEFEVPAAIEVVLADEPHDPIDAARKELLERSPIIGMAELRAAALMVAEGHASRVTLSGFTAWPGLLTELDRLSREHDVAIMPTIARVGGRIDLVVFREMAADD